MSQCHLVKPEDSVSVVNRHSGGSFTCNKTHTTAQGNAAWPDASKLTAVSTNSLNLLTQVAIFSKRSRTTLPSFVNFHVFRRHASLSLLIFARISSRMRRFPRRRGKIFDLSVSASDSSALSQRSTEALLAKQRSELVIQSSDL